MKAVGTFEVSLKPLEGHAAGAEGNSLGRMSIDKVFQGDLEAASRGEMLSARTRVPTSAGYVAIEQVQGNLSGKRGGFVFQHFGVMRAGEQRLILEVVPDSGTGELLGISGMMQIEIDESQHSYVFEYAIS